MAIQRKETDYRGVFYRETEGGRPSKIIRTYYIRYRIGGRAGKMVEEPVGKSTEKMTAAKASIIRAERMSGKTPSNREDRRQKEKEKQLARGRWTIARLWDEYKNNKPGLKGIVTDENRFQNYLKDFAGLTAEEITTQMVDTLRLKLTKAGKKAGTVKNVLELLRRIINFGVKKGLCSWQDPSRLHFEMPRLNNTKTEMLTEEERKRFIEAAKSAPNRKAGQLMLMAYYTGMRRSELFRLKWEHVDSENGFINIVGEGQEGAKSSRDERIPLSAPVRELLKEIGGNGSPYVFPGKDGLTRLTDINKQVNTIKKAANLPKDFRPLHGLRHTFASVAVSNGVPLSHVQKMLTHKDPTLTQRYAHLEDGALKRSAQTVGTLLETSAEDDSIAVRLESSPEAYALCSDIWLQASIVAHPFIDRDFWKNNQRAMAEQFLPASQVLMAYMDGIPVGFAASRGNTLEALFVLPTRWKNGIGRKLMERLFTEQEELNLAVYQKNQRAASFYQRMGFIFGGQRKCPHTGETEILMEWRGGRSR